jgi:hypothetical protein
MTSVGTMDRPAWKVCAPCGEKIKAQIEAAKAKPAPQPAPTCAYGCSDVQANTACPAHGKPEPAKPNESFCDVKYGTHPCSGVETLRWMHGVTSKPLWCCETCLLDREAVLGAMTKASGTPCTGPERLDRPKLTHVAGMHDDDLIGGAR